MLSFKSFILLIEATADELYNKFYSDIDKETFEKLWKADPTSKENMFGDYSRWILKLYKNLPSDIKDVKAGEDLYKIENDLKLYDRLKKANKIDNRDINFFRSFDQLYNFVKPYESLDTKTGRGLEKEIKKGAKKVFENSEWLIIIPETHDASCYYGSGTRWCTASRDGGNYFDNYSSKGPLYIIISKNEKDNSGRNIKYQLHFPTSQFMDSSDDRLYTNNGSMVDIDNISVWIDENLGGDVLGFFIEKQRLNLVGTIDFFIDQDKLSPSGIYNGDLTITGGRIRSLDGLPNKIDGRLMIMNTNIKDLDGSPAEVSGSLTIKKPTLSSTFSLDGTLEKVGGDFYCEAPILYLHPLEVGGNFTIDSLSLRSLDNSPDVVDGNFVVVRSLITSLRGSPKRVSGTFHCSYSRNLLSLEGAPNEVGGSFDCSNSKKLKTLYKGPRIVKGDYVCSFCGLEDLNGSPERIIGSFICSHNNLKNLIGSPTHIYGDFDCKNNPLKNLDGLPKYIGGNMYIPFSHDLIEWANLHFKIPEKIKVTGAMIKNPYLVSSSEYRSYLENVLMEYISNVSTVQGRIRFHRTLDVSY